MGDKDYCSDIARFGDMGLLGIHCVDVKPLAKDRSGMVYLLVDLALLDIRFLADYMAVWRHSCHKCRTIYVSRC